MNDYKINNERTAGVVMVDIMEYVVVLTNKNGDRTYLLQTEDLDEAKERARGEAYYIERDKRKGETVEVAVLEDYEEGNYNPIEF